MNELYAEVRECFEEVAVAMDKVHTKIRRLSDVSIKIGEKYGQVQNLLKADDVVNV